MEMPSEIRKLIEHLGMRSGVLSVWDRMHCVRLIKCKHAYYDLPHMFRSIEHYDHVRWNGCTEHMIDDLAEELRNKYQLEVKAVIRPKLYHVRKGYHVS